jgi:hypothetical protein
MYDRLEEAVRDLTTRDAFRADAIAEGVQINDDDSIETYWVSFVIPKGESIEHLDRYVKPCRLAILRGLQVKQISAGEPVIYVNEHELGQEVIIIVPVKLG